MKKAISVLLVLVLCLGLCACGENVASTEKVSTKNVFIGKESFTTAEFRDIVFNNEYKFQNTYVGKTVTVTGKITKIEGSYRSTNLNHYFEAVVIVDGLWAFEVSDDNPILTNANVGDLVTATGTISTSLGFEVYCYGNSKIA